MPPTRRRQLGLTLLEVLVATAVVALLAATLVGSLHAAFRIRRAATTGLASAREARVAVEAVARDLAAAARPTGILQAPFIAVDAAADSGAQGDSLTFTAARPAGLNVAGECDLAEVSFLLVRDDQLHEVAASGSADAARSGWTRRDTTGPTLPLPAQAAPSYALVRREGRRPLAPIVDTPVDQVLCRRVRSLSFRYFDGATWGDAWDSTAQGNLLPQAVEFTVGVDPPDSRAEDEPLTLRRVVRLPCADEPQGVVP